MKLSKLNTPQRYFSTLVISLLVTGGCSPKQPDSPIFKSALLDGLYSTRPSVDEPEITIVKLNTPSLLETSKRENGKVIVDSKQGAAIEAEQIATIESLKKISPDIRILMRYKLVLNGLVIWAPAEVLPQIKNIPNITLSEKSSQFSRLNDEDDYNKIGMVGDETSVKFIGAEAAYAQNIRGQGMRIGVIDTGVDYTHKMFGGGGTPEAYKAVNPAVPSSAFPTKKVVGGIDLAGTDFAPGSRDFAKRIPKPDANPLDEASHGTHVAGTIAGIGDGVNTYDGVAPEASLYAIKVFGKSGGTSDEVVIAALEYAADPTGDLSFKEQLDVVNLSLGSEYGTPHRMYTEAIKNLVRGGTVVVASGGNSGDAAYIVGSPGTSDDAISVASSIDDMKHNVTAPGAEVIAGETKFLMEIAEAQTTKRISELETAKGEVVFAGLADKDFDEAAAAQIKGKMALIDRGTVSFTDKITRAQAAGAIGVLVANNAPGEVGIMATTGQFEIPAVMISLDSGNKIKELMKIQPVVVDLKPAELVQKAWLADTISPFSSRGPRSEDGLIKPEISAPGTNIISAAVGEGDKGSMKSGTSMAGPHIAGVMGLLKQKFPDLSAAELKSVLLGHGKIISDKDKAVYPVARQGAGRVQVAESINAKVISSPATLSFGLVDIETQKALSLPFTLKNISTEALNLTVEWVGSKAISIPLKQLALAAGESKSANLRAYINAALMKSANEELDGFLQFKNGEEIVLQVPALAVTRQISRIEGTSLKVLSASADDAAGSVTELTLKNSSVNPGSAYIFNLLGQDGRKKDSKPDPVHSKNCDLQSAGYRVVNMKSGARILQVALKLYEGQTTWHRCEVNVQIDGNGDGLADQELDGTVASDVPGVTINKFASILLDANKARDLRKDFEKNLKTSAPQAENYVSALLGLREMQVFDNSTLAIIEADISALAAADTGELNIKVSTTHNDRSPVEYDDYLDNQDKMWQKISLDPNGPAYTRIPSVIDLKGQEQVVVPLKKGYGDSKLVIYSPMNKSVRDSLQEDTQQQILTPTFWSK